MSEIGKLILFLHLFYSIYLVFIIQKQTCAWLRKTYDKEQPLWAACASQRVKSKSSGLKTLHKNIVTQRKPCVKNTYCLGMPGWPVG